MNVIMNEDDHLFWLRRFADCLIVANWEAVPVAEKYTLFHRENWVTFVQAFPQGGLF